MIGQVPIFPKSLAHQICSLRALIPNKVSTSKPQAWPVALSETPKSAIVQMSGRPTEFVHSSHRVTEFARNAGFIRRGPSLASWLDSVGVKQYYDEGKGVLRCR
eukprot:scaffold521_cov226-Pinguiococcus_pyrenoidosus.AAC.6